MDLEQRGIPGVNVITTGFTDAAAVQSTALGWDPALVIVEHPIQNRTTAELQQLADAHFDAIMAKIRQ